MTRAPRSFVDRNPRGGQPSGPRERGGAVVWILALLVLAGVAFAVYWFVVRKAPGESSNLAARVLPADVDLVGGVDIARILATPSVRELAKKKGADLDALDATLSKEGVKLADLKSLVFGGRLGASELESGVVAVQAATDAKAAVGGVKMMLGMLPEPLAGVARGGRVEALDGGVVLTGSGDLLDKALAVAAGKAPALGDRAGLSDVRAALDEGGMVWAAGAIPAASVDALPGMVKSALGGTPSHWGVSATMGDRAEIRAVLFIPGADGDSVAKALGMFVGMAKLRLGKTEKAIADAIELSGEGSAVIARVSLDQRTLEELLAPKIPTEN